MKFIRNLTNEQKAAMIPHAEKWIERGWDTTPVDKAAWEKGARACYAYAGIPFPERVVWVPSPLVGALAAPIAAYLIALDRNLAQLAVGGAVGDAVRDAVRDAVGGAVASSLRSLWYYRLGGQWWTYWQAYNSYFRDVAGLELDPELWKRSYAYEQASTAGWWWPFRDFVMVSERPTELHLEQVGPTGWGSHRLHCETGPAIAWRDGFALYYWHGTRVPQDLIDGRWTSADILREANAEIRRCGIERMGWDRFVVDARLTPVGAPAPDPGNPGHHLVLYDVPEQLFDEPVRVLLATNGTVERDGTRRRFGLTVPANIRTPLDAAAWTYGLSSDDYARCQRRS